MKGSIPMPAPRYSNPESITAPDGGKQQLGKGGRKRVQRRRQYGAAHRAGI
ncbi:MAG: hypothetical protein IJP37_00930 [Clostridia bacterium]|nr:hypothetical protein [Clostridia bacterium]